MPRSEYFYPSEDMYLRTEHFALYDKDDLVEIMLHWFHENYEDPANSCPYDEGEYIYIYGGPVTMSEALFEEFKDTIDEEVIIDAVSGNGDDYTNWSLIPDNDWAEFTVTDPYEIFKENTDDIRRLSAVHNNDQALNQKYLGLLFSNALTAMETYLSDELINMLHKDSDCRNRFIEKISLKKTLKDELLSDHEKYWTVYVDKVYSCSFHNPKTIKNIFIYTSNIDAPITILWELEAIAKIRHDLIHRNGKDKEGGIITLSDMDLEWCLDNTEFLVEYIRAIQIERLQALEEYDY